MLSVQQALARHNLGRARDLLRLHEPKKGQPDLRGWEWRYYAGQCKGDEVFTHHEDGKKVTRLVPTPLNNGLIAGSADGSIDLWDFAGQRFVAHLCQEKGRIIALASDVEGRFLASQTVDNRGEGPVKIWDLSDLANVRFLRTLPANWLNEAGTDAFSSRRRWIALAAKFDAFTSEGISEGGQ